MDQINRILTLYQRLITGRIVDKTLFALEFDTTERSVDRDISAVRAFLSDSFSNLELIYDRQQRGYRLKNLRIKQEIALGECFLLSKMLLDNCPLRTDEQDELIQILMSQLSQRHRDRALPVLQHTPKQPERRDRASLQLIEDLLYSIEQKDQITLHFGMQYFDEPCIPYSVEVRGREAYLVALKLDDSRPALLCLDDIKSYRQARKPYLLSPQETADLQALVENVCNALRTGADTAVKAATAGAITVVAKRGLLGVITPLTEAVPIANLACVAVENVKTLGRAAAGELTAGEALDKMAGNTVAMYYGLSCSTAGMVIGAAALGWIPIAGPIIGGVAGGVIGYAAGSKFGQSVYKAAKNAAKTAVKTVKKATEGAKKFARKAMRGVGRLFGLA